MNNNQYIFGVEPDAPVVENKNGGKQSDTPYGFHLLPANALFDAAKVAKYGAEKYGETFTDRNYRKIDTVDHLNHALQHIYAFIAGDKQDDHLGHAIVRLMFAYDVNERGMIGTIKISDDLYCTHASRSTVGGESECQDKFTTIQI